MIHQELWRPLRRFAREVGHMLSTPEVGLAIHGATAPAAKSDNSGPGVFFDQVIDISDQPLVLSDRSANAPSRVA